MKGVCAQMDAGGTGPGVTCQPRSRGQSSRSCCLGRPWAEPRFKSVPRARWTQEGHQQEAEIQAEAAQGAGEQGGQAGEGVREHSGGSRVGMAR